MRHYSIAILALSILFVTVACSPGSSSPGSSPAAASNTASSAIVLNANESNSISIARNPLTNCAITPSLPQGITLNPANCTISGTPRGVLPAANYTLYATGASGPVSISISLSAAVPAETLMGVADVGFGTTSGLISTGPTGLTVRKMAVDSSGRMVVVSSDSTGSVIEVTRFNKDGSLDTTFSGGGTAEILCSMTGNAACTPYVIQAQTDNQIVVAGVSGSNFPSDSYFAVRLSADGIQDMKYGTNGVASANFNGGVDPTFLIGTLDSSGNLVLAGENALVVNAVQDFYPAMARFTSSGALDASFGTGGMMTIMASAPGTGPAGNIVRNMAYDVNSQSFYLINANGNLGGVLVRVTSSGVWDTSFGASGWVITNDQGYNDGDMLAVQYWDGSIVAGNGLELQRFSSAGVLDTKFGTAGTVSIRSGANNAVLLIEPSEDLLVVSTAGNSVHHGFSLVNEVQRVTPSGQLDSTFGTSGSFSESPVGLQLFVDGMLLSNGNVMLLDQIGGQISFLQVQ